jgi:PTS system cellobiose-specific IIA component
LEELETIIFQLISKSGSAKSYAFQALKSAKEGRIERAKEEMKNAEEELLEAHKVQTQLIYNEANGKRVEVSVLFVHAQDHLMSAILAKDLIYEMIDMEEEIQKQKLKNIGQEC